MTNIPIFLSSDNNYAPFVATTIASICDNTKSFIDFYVLDGGITVENQAKIEILKESFDNFSIEFIKIDIETYFKDFKENEYFTKSMYSRFLIPNLKPSLDKALYSDVDVIVLGDIAEMYTTDLEGYAIGAVWEEMFEADSNQKRKKNLNLSSLHKYFMSGNLIIDCQQWRANNVVKDLLAIEKTLITKTLPDQDILNKCFDNNYKVLAKKFCFLSQEAMVCENSNIIIRHFEGKAKPWHLSPDTKTSLMPHLQDFWKYAKKTAFYSDLLEKTFDITEQEKTLRHLRFSYLIAKKHFNINQKLGMNNS